ncbi:MAG: outer membrane lipoprotein chaperone LolA [Porticoccaceae bacterium]|nr:outer membrane lipoprotein chaperone LolA [Porticoccaceae bacterium]
MKLFCWALMAIFTTSISWAEITKDASEQLADLLSPINSFSANFSQQLLDSKGNSYQKLTGIFHGKKPNQVHWTVFQPAAQTIVSNGARLWLYDPDLEQVIVEPYANNPETNPIILLLGSPQQISESFNVTGQKLVNDSTQQFILEPIALTTLYKQLSIEFSKGSLSGINFTDNLGQKTLIEFQNFILNPSFEDNFFTFKIPEGVDVVSHGH